MKKIKFPLKEINGAITVILQDYRTKIILDTDKMDQTALERTIKSNCIHLRKTTKEQKTNNNYLQIKQIHLNKNQDTLLIQVIPTQKYQTTAWGEINEKNNKFDFINELEKIIENRRLYGDEKSYTSSLFRSGLNKIAQKVGEEATEFIIEAKDQNNEKAFLNEGADLIFHFLVLLNFKGFHFKDIVKVLKKRQERGKIVHKIDNLKNKIHR
ncbi:MAG: phosphoribosyl-ATP diphosphatase [Flavobacteriales bacterium Tduv]